MAILGIWWLDPAIRHSDYFSAVPGLMDQTFPLHQGSWNLDLSDLDCRRAVSDVEGQELERPLGARGVDEPPDHVAAEEARCDRCCMTQRA